MVHVVMLDPGHGGSDSGAVANGLLEKNMNLITSLACRNELQRLGIEVHMTRTTDVYVDLSERSVMSNNLKPELFLSIHYNAGGGDGAEGIFSAFHGELDDTLAKNLVSRLSSECGQNARPIPTYSKLNSRGTDYYSVNRETEAPSVIIEGAFIDNSNDVMGVDTITEQQRYGVAYAHAICDTLGVPVVAPVVVIPPQPKPAINVLKLGDKSTAVMDLQNKLNKIGYKLATDGSFGPLTEAAVKDFQSRQGLVIDGVVGPLTAKKLDDVLTAQQNAARDTAKKAKVVAYQNLTRQLGIKDKNGNLLVADGDPGDLTKSTYIKMPVLSVGSHGPAVAWIQGVVGAAPIDSSFGKITAGKVGDYQRAHGVGDDTVVGPCTYKVLVEG